jgi:hypothetical protein
MGHCLFRNPHSAFCNGKNYQHQDAGGIEEDKTAGNMGRTQHVSRFS